ncbi:uncharacterized protein MELLADRAFT_66785 [Melampsora larici-populina 98AG31]|uniref:Uncharacterized protein n=1 Tax=Melampsora larici-populina (strain 98AG31 / pathotype 3-4-7) TaxID=747676 RepID=F4S0K2_MELLP|nr:uncharacterized protein MELLADRAFT_66785 [Melampsora larici-populina 98AG31]EGG01852.1 hypothetical protein MELLADRAFT_66785 [Melampsora larici-populina 98AG31]
MDYNGAHINPSTGNITQLQQIHQKYDKIEGQIQWVEQSYHMLIEAFGEDELVWQLQGQMDTDHYHKSWSTGYIASFIKAFKDVKFMAEECTKQWTKDRNWR